MWKTIINYLIIVTSMKIVNKDILWENEYWMPQRYIKKLIFSRYLTNRREKIEHRISSMLIATI